MQQFDDSVDIMGVYNILGSCINGLLHKKNNWGSYDGDIRPYNVFLFPDNCVKLSDYMSLPQ